MGQNRLAKDYNVHFCSFSFSAVVFCIGAFVLKFTAALLGSVQFCSVILTPCGSPAGQKRGNHCVQVFLKCVHSIVCSQLQQTTQLILLISRHMDTFFSIHIYRHSFTNIHARSALFFSFR